MKYEFIIIIHYNIYRNRPLEAQNAKPTRKPEGGRSEGR
jgi:hypothetical protein